MTFLLTSLTSLTSLTPPPQHPLPPSFFPPLLPSCIFLPPPLLSLLSLLARSASASLPPVPFLPSLSRYEYVAIRELACGLSLLCQGSKSVKLQFGFGLFDADGDECLTILELQSFLARCAGGGGGGGGTVERRRMAPSPLTRHPPPTTSPPHYPPHPTSPHQYPDCTVRVHLPNCSSATV